MKIYTILTLLIFCLFHQSIQAQGTFRVSAGATVTTKGNSVITLNNAKFSNDGTFAGTSGTVLITGNGSNANTTIEGTGTTTFKNLTINKTANNAQLNKNIAVTGNLTLSSGGVSLNSGNIDFGSTGTLLNETETKRIFGTGGYLQATVTLNAPNNRNPANLGAVITSAANLGSTVIKRIHTPFTLSRSGMNRSFDITPTNNTALNATLRYNYFDGELNGNNKAVLALWKSTDAGTSFTELPSTNVDYSNYIQSSGIASLGLFSGGITAGATAPFKTTWIATGGSITIPTLSPRTYDYTINYRKKGTTPFTTVTGQTGNYTISGLTANDTIQVEITGVFPYFYMNDNATEKTKLLSIDAWGNQKWKSMEYAFTGCSNLTYNATDNPDLSSVVSLYRTFTDCSKFNGDISGWQTDNVTDMNAMFLNASVFNQNISSWNTANVTNMARMFYGAKKFNQNIGGWNTAKVIDMSQMFGSVDDFNQNLSSWNTANVLSMNCMFCNAIKFNQPLTNWNTSKVTDMTFMFVGASAFDQDLSVLEINAIVYIQSMLEGSKLSVANYDATLIGWLSQNKTGLNLGTTGLKYCTAQTARTTLVTPIASGGKGWTITGDALLCPGITTTGTLSEFSACAGTASTLKSFSISGNGLTADITITAPTGFEISITSGGFGTSLSLTQSSGSVPNTTIYVRMAATATGTPSGNITCASIGFTTQNVAASGTVNPISTITVSISPTIVCAGASQTLSTVNTNAGSTPTYLWKRNNVNLATTATISVVNAVGNDVYSVRMTPSANICPNTPTATASLTITPLTPAKFSITPYIVCEGTNQTLSIAPAVNLGTSPSYVWKLNGSDVGTSSTYAVSNAVLNDVYSVAVTPGSNAPGCLTVGTQNLTIGCIRSITSGNWEDPATWNLNRVPLTTDNAVIDNNHNVTINTDGANANKTEVRVNSKLIYGNSSAKLKLGF